MNKIQKLDKNSEYFRSCPECKKEFITDHLNRSFCNNLCHDRYHNRNKRLNKYPQVNYEANKTLPKEPFDIDLFKVKLKMNIDYLDSLIVHRKGTEFDVVEFGRNNFDFEVNEGIFNLDKDGEYVFVRYGDYKLYRTEIDKIGVLKLNHIKTI